ADRRSHQTSAVRVCQLDSDHFLQLHSQRDTLWLPPVHLTSPPPADPCSMPIIYRLRDVTRTDEIRLRDAFEAALDGDWCLTVSQSHIDGQWHLQLEGRGQRRHAVIPSFDDDVLAELAEALGRRHFAA